ncbi:MAG TPA: prolyl oligopeptidase family serine peptidase [Pyrinomonadaceae bacterium]|nr:prolyl oligopeptidase family serine peptidase [Pyrinomonadaceae bacterium]
MVCSPKLIVFLAVSISAGLTPYAAIVAQDSVRAAHSDGRQLIQNNWSPAGAKRPISIDHQLTMRRPSQVLISPDGKWVAFALTTPDLGNNRYQHNTYVVPADGSTGPRQLTYDRPQERSSTLSLLLAWTPTSDGLIRVIRSIATGGEAKSELRILNIENGREKRLLTDHDLQGGQLVSNGASGSAFSSSGNQLAFLVSKTESIVPSAPSRRGIDIQDPDWRADSPRSRRVLQLLVMDLMSKRVHPVTDNRINVNSFSWSPDGTRLAIEASPVEAGTFGRSMKVDIFIVDAFGKELRPCVQIRGRDRAPVWSPNGKHIAFATQRGEEDWMYAESLAVIEVDGKNPPRVIGRELDRIAGSRISSLRWTVDGDAIDVLTSYHLAKHLFRVRVADGATSRLTREESRSYGEAGFSYSEDGTLMAFTNEGVGVPPEVYVTPVERMSPIAITHLNPEWDALSVPTSEIVKWPSRDGKWVIHGLLLKPSSFEVGRSYPIIVCNSGGPSMVIQATNPVEHFPILALAEMGYLVLIPNTRGRNGFGLEFTHAIRDERSYVTNAVEDVLTGVDAMITSRVADPSRIGVFGFSYGDTLTLNLIIKSDRFKAAISGDGAGRDMLPMLTSWETFKWSLMRDMWGIPNPYDADNIRRAFEQTPIFHLERVKTPVLIESGEGGSWEGGQKLYRGLLHFGVPSEHVVYPRSTHGWDEPVLKQDSYLRHISWFDYWLRDKPYRNSALQTQYDRWKVKRARELQDLS